MEESRRALRALLNRRDFINWSAAVAATASGLAVAGCGSGDNTVNPPPPPPPPPPPGTIPTGFQATAGTISLPNGLHLVPTDLTVDVLMQSAPVSASSTFTIGLTEGGPALALLLDKNGDGVLMSMFDAAGGSPVISARTTAVALLFYATGAMCFSADIGSRILALLNADPAVGPVEAAVAQAVAADPQALANGAAPIGAAISAAVQALMGEALQAAPAPAPRASSHAMMNASTLMTLNSLSDQNGLILSMDTTTTSLLLANNKRRAGRAYVYELTTQVIGSPQVDITPAKYIAGPITVDPTEPATLSNVLKDILTLRSGASPWAPVNVPPIPVALDTGKDLTTLNLVVVTAALKGLAYDTWEPAFFRDAHFAGPIAAQWQADEQALLREILFADILLPIVSFVLGYGMLSMVRNSVVATIAAASTVEKATMDTIIATLQYGSMGQLKSGLAEIVQNAYNSQLYTGLFTKEVNTVMGPARAQAIAAGQSASAQAMRLTRAPRLFSKIFAPLFGVGVGLAAIDFTALLYDLLNSEIGTLWEVVLTKQTLGLVPDKPRIASGQRVHFRVTAPASIPAGSYEFDWTQTSIFAELSAVGEANVGSSITTTKLAVDLQTLGSDVNPINVLVIGYDTSKSPRQEFGRSGTTVNFLLPAEILPSNASMELNDQRVFSVLVTGQLPNGVLYKWTASGAAGSIGNGTITTTVPQINVSAGGVPGNGALHVDVVDGAGMLWAQADVGFLVNGPPSISFTIAGAWDPAKQPPDATYNYPSVSDSRGPVPNQPGLDAIFFIYDVGTVDQTIGVLVTVIVPTGSVVRTGQQFTKFVSGTLSAGEFQLTLASNQANPDDSASSQYAPVGTGTLTFDNVSQLLDGKWVVRYSFTIANPGGGTIVGNGTAKWT